MKALRVIKMLAFVVVAVIVFGFVAKELWNWLIPSIFGLRAITFAEAIGLVVLGKILFGGFHKHGQGRQSWNEKREWKRRMRARWSGMSEEERARFRSGMKGRWNCGGFGHDEKPVEQNAQ